MPNQLKLTGFDELRRQLVALPKESVKDADPILLKWARLAQAEVVAAYPQVTGQLRQGVKLIPRVARGMAALWTVATTAPYAHIYEFGSARQAGKATFLPITERDRRASVIDVAATVEAKGLKVSGARD